MPVVMLLSVPLGGIALPIDGPDVGLNAWAARQTTWSLCYTRRMESRLKLLEILADGRFWSGEALGARLGVSRAAVWKRLRALKRLGLEIQAVRGRGYRVAHPIELLNAGTLLKHLSPSVQAVIPCLDIFTELDSTNTYLKARALGGAPGGSVCLAEMQSAGRGRLGRVWVSPFASNLYLSLLWRYAAGPAALAGLSLVAGVALVRALKQFVPEGLGLKWPNDVQWQGRKLAGVLIEMAGESAGPSHAVIGIGVNVRMPDAAAVEIGQPWVDLTHCLGGPPSRNALAAAVLESLIESLRQFDAHGLRPFLDVWREHDVMAGRPVQLHLPNSVVAGEARGIDDSGALMLQIGDELRSFAAGEISLRMSS